MNVPRTLRRNPGPNWGYGFLLWAERWWPRWFFRPMLMAGTWVGVAVMSEQRRQSRDYLAVVLRRPPRLTEIWRHFFSFADFLMLKLRAGRGAPVKCVMAPEHEEDFERLMASGRPALFGTFHFGASDLLGYLLSHRGRRVSVLRLQVDNSMDTRLLGERYGKLVSFLWVNDPATLLFALKAALEAGESVALKCDRVEFSMRTAVFRFLDANRIFPVTIYSLAALFNRPVVFCFAIPSRVSGGDELRIYSSAVFTPDPTAGRTANLEAGHHHFQGVLDQLEAQLRRRPDLWFNYLPMNPVAPS